MDTGMGAWLTKAFSWMEWTPPVAIFFVCIGLMLVGMTVWEIRAPTIERKGLLPMRTTRGDRLFIGLLLSAYVNLVWLAVTDMTQWIGAGLGFLLLGLVMLKG
jgi:predicted small integral membrane protein